MEEFTVKRAKRSKMKDDPEEVPETANKYNGKGTKSRPLSKQEEEDKDGEQ
jgi:hypothetical protein